MAKEIKKKAGVSGNSVAGKSYQIFTVSEELLAKVVEAVQAGEKKARSSGEIQSFEVFCHGFRANISLGRIMVIPPAICNDRKNFPTALLYGTIVRIFGTGGEEVSDLIEKKIGENEFDEYSQADFDTLKEEIFKDVRTGEEECLVVFAPNWMNSREYIAFHFSEDSEQLKNDLRHQVFSAYYNPAVSSAFNALMTNVDTTHVDVTDITPKITYPFITANPLKQFPQLEKSATFKKATILLNKKTADEVAKQTLEPQELNVFDSLNQALENSLLPDADGAQGEGGFKAPEAKPGVPREAAKEACAPHETPFTNVGPGTEAHAEQEASASAMKESVGEDNPEHRAVDGEPIGIAVDETGVPRRKEEEAKVSSKKAANPPTNKQEVSHPETLRVGQERLSSAYSAAYNGGFVDKHAMPPQEVRAAMAEIGDNNKPAPQAAVDHAKMVEAGAFGEDPLTRRSNEKWGSATVKTKKTAALSGFERGYLEAALWSTNDNSTPQGGEPLDKNYGFEDIDEQSLAKMKQDCVNFQKQNAALLEEAYQRPGYARSGEWTGEEMAGHDFWLTRNGHGVGFWDRDALREGGLGDKLTQAAKQFRESDLYVGDDNRVHVASDKKFTSAYVANKMANIVDSDGGYEAMSAKAKTARAAKEAKLNKMRPKVAVELDIDSIWDAITEDMGPAPLVDVEAPGNDTPSNTEDQGGWNEDTSEGNESKGRPNKRDVQDLPEAFRSDEPEDKKEISDSEAEQEETGFENEVTKEEEHHESSWRMDSKFADFVDEVYADTNNSTGICPECDPRGMGPEEALCPDCGNCADCCMCGGFERANARQDEISPMGHCLQCDASVPKGKNFCSEECLANFNQENRVGTPGGFEKESDDEGSDAPNAAWGITPEDAAQMIAAIRHGDRVTILVPGGRGRQGIEWKESRGKAVMHSSHGGWVLNMGGAHGTPGIADVRNIIEVRRGKAVPGQQRLGAETKQADTADNGYDIDSAANPTTKENGPSDTVECHQDYNTENSEGTDRPKPGQGADIKQSSKTAEKYDSHGMLIHDYDDDEEEFEEDEETIPTRFSMAKIMTALQKAGFRENADGDLEHPKFGLFEDQSSGNGYLIGLGGKTYTSFTPLMKAIQKMIAARPKKVVKKRGDTADNPASEKGGEGIIQPKTDADVKDTSGAEIKNTAADVSGDFAEAKSETDSTHTVDVDIAQPTESVEEAGKWASERKWSATWMNEHEINMAADMFPGHPVLGPATRFLQEFVQQVNSHSDGWPYWKAPAHAAGQLMALINGAMQERVSGRGSEWMNITPQQLAKAMAPIKSFMTRKGLAAGMEMPKLAADVSGDVSEAKSEVDYNKADVANEPEAEDTVNPAHFSAKGTCAECGSETSLDKNGLCSECRMELKAAADRHDDVPEVDVPSSEGAKQPVSDLSGAAPEASDIPVQLEHKRACGADQPEEMEFDFGAGDLADIVLIEDEGEKNEE